MDQISKILSAPRTPDTIKGVANALNMCQFEKSGTVIASVFAFDWVMIQLKAEETVPLALQFIMNQMNNFEFYKAQITTMAEIIVTKFGRQEVRVPPSGGMGGFPADDDDDVIIVEVSKATKLDETRTTFLKTTQKLNDALSKGEKSLKVCLDLATRHRELTTALGIVSKEHNQALREVQNDSALADLASNANKAALEEFEKANKEYEEEKQAKKRRRE